MPKTADEVWAAVQAEVSDMARHISGDTHDPMAGFTDMQRTVVRIYVVNAWRLAQRDMAERMAEVADA